MKFDFSKLNDREFEVLSASIIERILDKRVEIFKPGKDGGVDGRFWIGKEKEAIIQCKHYFETPYKNLIYKLKTEEFKKVQKLKPSKYIFVTSKNLSRSNKEEIKQIFAPFILREDDIFGREDLNSFLSKRENQDIVEQNFKLWISSSSILEIIYNNAIKGRSENTIREIKGSNHKYAITENHQKGLKILEDKNVIILTGEPGIGKTTLADNLALIYIAKGYEFYDIEESISEAESLFRHNEKRKILFYCDDFLGSNLYDAINNKRDSHIVKFINRVSQDNSKKFILTSRTNILNKAYSFSHQFQNGKIRDNEFLLRVENLTLIDKAKILYNHIYHSQLAKEYIDKIYQEKRYKAIIKHRNFNPRIIGFVTDSVRVGNIKSENYWNYIKKSLEHPEDIWADYFQNQTDDCVRALTFLTVYNNGKISEDLLRESYNQFLEIHSINLGDHSDKSFEAVRKLATKSLLNRNHIGVDKYEYTLFNPSIADFILNSYSGESQLISNILISLNSENAISYFKSISLSGKVKKLCLRSVQEKLFKNFYQKKLEEENWDFLITLIYLDYFNDQLETEIKLFIKTLTNSECPCGQNLYELLRILTGVEYKLKFDNYDFLYKFIDTMLDEDTLKILLNFIEEFNVNDSHILSVVEDHIEVFLEQMASEYNLDIDFSNYINNIYYPDGNRDFEIDISGAESEAYDRLSDFLSDFNQSALDRIDVNIGNIVSNIDMDHRANIYLENYARDSYYDDDHRGSYRSSYSLEDDIDSIFER
ncbi:restriction endonuclease [Zunongwangia endophytica]|uniref:Restriction endonuclease n=1 Tax=Zunongwangia endophytica TaxID=1808945 RepID=A0ABV8H137_9FLAO|nr:restriction endonuclease [Zunongwangia endophytica]MDN3594316.1 restriction endonuclease [Zunongwangia endophytica]